MGIDAKAQNSPCTSVDVTQAARALNVVLALAPASIAIFANSPLENGRATGLKENRLTVWDRMFRHSRYAGDYQMCIRDRGQAAQARVRQAGARGQAAPG